MHLVAAGLDVIGVTVPGTPFIVLGHNAQMAWGMTNTGADVQDLYVERIDLARKRYWYRGQWLPLQVARTEIPIRGAAPQPFEVWRTRHGTVFAEVGLEWDDAPVWLASDADRTGERRAFALRWDAAGGEMAGAFEALNRATTWADFTSAVERFAAPSQNFVYADVEGNIGYAMSGVLPVRSGGVGMFPNDGTTGEGEWSGSVGPAALPRLFNPPRGFITSSNNQIDRSWPGLITRDWALPFRTQRLHDVLAETQRVDLQTAAAWQNDLTALDAAAILRHLPPASAAPSGESATMRLSSTDHQPPTTDYRPPTTEGAAGERTLNDLRGWNHVMDDRPIVTVYHLFEDALWRRTFVDEMAEELFERFFVWAGAERPAGLHAIIDDQNSRWFDDIGTLDRRETRDDIYRLAASDATARLARDFDGGMSWSRAHAARFEHPLGAGARPLSWLFNRGPSEVSGGISTVMRISHHRLRPFAAWEAPSWRELFDVGNWDGSQVVLPAGQSGHPLSPHYFDQNEMWRLGQYRSQPFSRAAVDAARAHRLLLLP